MNSRLLNLRFTIGALQIVVLFAVVSASGQEAGDSARKDPAPKAQTGENVTASNSAPPAASTSATFEEKTASDTASRALPGRPVAEAAQSGSSGGWKFQFSPYLFMMGLNGTIGARGVTTDVNVKFTDIIDEVNFGFMGAFEARKNKVVFLTDMLYANLSDSAGTPGPLFSSAKVDLKLFILDPEVGYRLGETDQASVDVLAGIRYWHLKTSLDLREGILPARQEEQAKNWVDAVVGLRGKVRIKKRWFASGKFDLGGGGSDFTFQLFGGFGVDVTRNASLVFGYRHLSVDYDDDTGFLFDAAMKGPVLGLSLRF